MHVLCGRARCLLPDAGRESRVGRGRGTEQLDLIADPKLRAMVEFAVKCARNPQSLAPSDFSKMRAFGLRESEIVELIGMAAFAVYANIIADATAMQGDESSRNSEQHV